MAERIDLTGQKFGRLVAVGYAGFERHHARWRCRCECGREVVVAAQKLRTSFTRSCGCLKSEIASASRKARRFSHRIDDAFLRDNLAFDPESRRVVVKVAFGDRLSGEVLDRPSRDGKYFVVKISRRRWLSHRLIWFLVKGEWPPGGIDHRDLDGMNNDPENLRVATKAQNNANSRPRGRSGVKGVSKLTSGRFCARITFNGATSYLGSFDTADEASSAYATAARQSFGDFARIA